MLRLRRSLAGAVALASVFCLLLAPQPAFAYQGTNCPTGTISADPVVGNGGDTVTVTVTITNCNGDPASGVLVVFTQVAGPCPLVFNPPQAITDANGQVHTTVTLPKNCPCQYTIQATAASVNVTLTTTIRENGCLPFTSAALSADAAPGSIDPLAAAAVGLALVAAGAVTLFLRSRRTV